MDTVSEIMSSPRLSVASPDLTTDGDNTNPLEAHAYQDVFTLFKSINLHSHLIAIMAVTFVIYTTIFLLWQFFSMLARMVFAFTNLIWMVMLNIYCLVGECGSSICIIFQFSFVSMQLLVHMKLHSCNHFGMFFFHRFSGLFAVYYLVSLLSSQLATGIASVQKPQLHEEKIVKKMK